MKDTVKSIFENPIRRILLGQGKRDSICKFSYSEPLYPTDFVELNLNCDSCGRVRSYFAELLSPNTPDARKNYIMNRLQKSPSSFDKKPDFDATPPRLAMEDPVLFDKYNSIVKPILIAKEGENMIKADNPIIDTSNAPNTAENASGGNVSTSTPTN